MRDAGHGLNHVGQPVGLPLDHWSPPAAPGRMTLEGRFCRLEPLDPGRHGRALHEANQADLEGRLWTYLPYGPFADFAAYEDWLKGMAAQADPLFFAVIDSASSQPAGLAAFLRIDTKAGSIEVGHLAYAPVLQRTRASTEAMYLMMQWAFEAGYRRYEWKCNALNAASRRAAERLGFSYEGTCRQANVVKGRNRDTAWYSIIDGEWPAVRATLQKWLAAENFDAQGRQRAALSMLMAQAHSVP